MNINRIDAQGKKNWGKTFLSLQYCSYAALWYDMKFSKQRLKNYNKFMWENNNTLLSREAVMKDQRWIEDWLGYPLKNLISKITVPDALAINKGIKILSVKTFLSECHDGANTFLVIAIGVLRRHYRFKPSDVETWWSAVLDSIVLYREGMTDDDVIKYFKEECDLDIYE